MEIKVEKVEKAEKVEKVEKREEDDDDEEIFTTSEFADREKLRLMYKLLNAALWNLNPDEFSCLKVKMYKTHLRVCLQDSS